MEFDYQPNDLNSVKILICYLIHNLETGINSDELYDIAVNSGIITHFYYSEAIEDLLVNDTILSDVDAEGNTCFSLSEKGKLFVKDFSSYVERSFRNRIMYAALQYKARKLRNASFSLDYEDSDSGCVLSCSISDGSRNLVEFRLLTQNRTQAELIGERISDNPSSFYQDFIEYSLQKRIPAEKE
ncbi:MAG: DUF4364 family protein [Oscillospiraceae bacterium]|nr:DUF4364 family protein [Oscillospiraceae bacterium]